MAKNTYPSWVLAHKAKGTEIRKFGEKYYLYQVKAFWDKARKKSRKKTLGLLGRITEAGLLASKSRISPTKASQITVLESGMSEYVYAENQDILVSLRTYFPQTVQALFLLAMFRLAYQSPLKNMAFHYEHSYIHQILGSESLGKNHLTALLREVGGQRAQISLCLKQLMGNPAYVLLDQTHIVSLSAQLEWNRLGYNSQRSFDPQVNLLFIFSPQAKTPLYYRLLAGDIRETKALKLTVEESGLQEAIVIADKGFYSAGNLQNLQNEGLDYILPLRRSHHLCDYTVLSRGNKQALDGFFIFENRVIWYKKYAQEGHQLVLFLDEVLKQQEEKDYLSRIVSAEIASSATPETAQVGEHPYSLPKFYEKQFRMGTITLDYSLKKNQTAEEIFTFFKSRNEVENTFDAYKNILDSDKTYMQSQTSMEAWTFINFLALIMYFRIYRTLAETKKLKNDSPKDILLFLAHIKKLKINQEWMTAEISQKSQKIIDLLRNNKGS
jgi:Transposase DDE domain